MEATGPRTEAGKTASSRNAVKHGLLSESPLVTCLEKAGEWQSHLDGVLTALSPNDQMETCLAERSALLMWRLRRIARAEVAWIDQAQADVEMECEESLDAPTFDEAGDSVEDRLDFAACCKEDEEFYLLLAEQPAEAVLCPSIAVNCFHIGVEVADLRYSDTAACPGLVGLRDLENREWTAGFLRECLSWVSTKAGKSPSDFHKAFARRLGARTAISSEEAAQAEAALKRLRNKRSLPGRTQIEMLVRYEAHLGRELARTMKALRELQARPSNQTGNVDPMAGEPSTPRVAHANNDLVASTPGEGQNGAHRLIAAPKNKNCETNSPLPAGSQSSLASERPVSLRPVAPCDALPTPAEVLLLGAPFFKEAKWTSLLHNPRLELAAHHASLRCSIVE